MDLTIATWNCFQGTDQKLPALMQAFGPDIAVVPESSSSPAIATPRLIGEAFPHVWTGSSPSKGLGIYGRPGASLVAREVIEGRSEHGLAVDVDLEGHQLSVLGIWTVPLPGTGHPTPYMGALAHILDRHAALIATGQTVVAGDINCSAQSSPDSFAGFFQELLDRHGLVSAYHHHTGLAFGSEAHGTLYWRRKRNASYHCDVILVPESWQVHDVHVGDYETWCADDAPARSDHVPVVARVSLSGASTPPAPPSPEKRPPADPNRTGAPKA